VRKNKKVMVNIPAGIDNGQTVSMRGRGHAGSGGRPAGDLLITVYVQPHQAFTREGTAVHSQIRVSVVQAILGHDLEVDTLDGKVKYTIQGGTQSGTVFRLRGRGVPYLNDEARRGDHYVKVIVDIPGKLTAQQRDLLEKFGESMGQNATGGKSGFFDKKRKGK